MNDLKENLNENAHIDRVSEQFLGVRWSDSSAVTGRTYPYMHSFAPSPFMRPCNYGNRSVLLPRYSNWRRAIVCVSTCLAVCAKRSLRVVRARGLGRVQFYSIHFTIFIHFSEFLGFLGFEFSCFVMGFCRRRWNFRPVRMEFNGIFVVEALALGCDGGDSWPNRILCPLFTNNFYFLRFAIMFRFARMMQSFDAVGIGFVLSGLREKCVNNWMASSSADQWSSGIERQLSHIK